MRGRDYLWLTILGILVVLHAAPAGPRRDASYERFRRLVTILEQVQRNYVVEVNEEELFLGAYRGMVFELDPYSQYMTAQDVEQLRVDTEGEFGGLGIEITLDEHRILQVITPLEDTPAMRAGVLPGDRIIEIDGQTTRRMSLLDAVRRLRGRPGTRVTITVINEARTGRQEITIVRDIIRIQSVRVVEMIDPEAHIGYIRVTNFQQNTPEQLDRAVQRLLEQGMRALVLDLRRNPGGLLSSAVAVADRFIGSGVLVSTRGRSPDTHRRFEAHRQGTYPNFPLAVLISRYSASASEIVAGAIQDHRRGILVGMRTFGKGSVQSILPLEGGARLRLTTARYYTPSGRCIHREVDAGEEDPWGIRPDIRVPVTPEEEVALLRHWRDQRVRQNTRDRPQPDRTEQPNPPEPPEPPAPRPDAGERPGQQESRPFVDRALVRAVDALKAILVLRGR